MALDYFSCISIVGLFKCYKTHIYITVNNKIVMTQFHRCINITVSNQSTTNLSKLTSLPKFVIKFQKQKLFRNISKAIFVFAQNNGSSAIHAILEVINYLVFLNIKYAATIGKYYLITGKSKLF